jgi:Nif-specific regulatory protein
MWRAFRCGASQRRRDPDSIGTDHAASYRDSFSYRLAMTKRTRSVDLEHDTIHEISKALRSTPELGKTLRSVVDVLSKQRGVSHAMVTLVTPSGEVELVASSGVADDDFARPGHARNGESRQPMSIVGVPIKACGRDLGVLSCARGPSEPNGSFQQDVRLLSIVAHLIGEAVKLPESTSDRDAPVSEARRVH